MASPLSLPLELPCGLVLKNRIAKSAMSEQLGSRRHAPTGHLERLYRRWSAGGAGLLMTGNVMVSRRALGEPRNVCVEDDRDLEVLKGWAQAGSEHGCSTWMQLNHPGRQSPRYLSRQPVAPSAVPLRVARRAFAPPRALRVDEIRDIIDRFARSAAVAQAAGFGGVQVHGAHGYLVSQFLSPKVNLRDDEWGGDPVRRRRFLLEVVAAIREAVGPRFPVGVKLNSADFQRGGLTPEESVDVVSALADAGVDLVELSGGTYESSAMMGRSRALPPRTREREAYFLEQAERVRATVKIPLMLTGGFRTREAMERAISDEVVDVVGLARPLCLDPELPAKLLAGSVETAPERNPRVGLRTADSLLQIVWHTQQLHRIGRGGNPKPDFGAWRSLATSVMTTGINSLRRTRAR